MKKDNLEFSSINICGRTKKQQDKVEEKLLKQGSLWGKFDILHDYVFTRKEFNQVRRANELIFRHENKRMSLLKH